MNRLNRSGDLYLTHTMMHDRFTLRFCAGQTHTRRYQVLKAWGKIKDLAAELECSWVTKVRGSAPPLALKVASLIRKETKRIYRRELRRDNIKYNFSAFSANSAVKN